MRRCTRCGERKATDQFRWQPSVGSYHSWCRDCEREHRRANPRTRRSTRPTVNAQGRAFGVELELTGPDPQTIINALRSAGVDVTNVGTYRASNGAQWELKHDGSVSGYGLELVSPKLRGEAGFNELRTVMIALNSVNATVNRSTGTHVHIDFRGLDMTEIRRQVISVILNQENVFRMVAPSRRHNVYCPRFRAEDLDYLRTTYASPQNMRSTRGVVNLGAYPRHGSIEFRAHGGTTNYNKLSAWIRFLFKALETDSEVVYNSPAEWLDALGVSREDSARLLRFELAAEQLEEREYEEASA